MIGPLRIVADDLTGALDAAAPFASPDRPVELPWLSGVGKVVDRVAVTSESRNVDRRDAVARTLRSFEQLGGRSPGALWFKKIDSVLRGHAVAEVAALLRGGGFRRCVFAPAFPQMGRITRGGRQFLLHPEGARPVGPSDLVAAFAAEGLEAAATDGPLPTGTTVLVADAETPDDLLAVTQAHAGSADILWAGSAGLAAALSGPSTPRPAPPIGAIVVGTTHPVTRAQVRAVEPLIVRATRQGPLPFDLTKPLLIDPVAGTADEVGTRLALVDAVRRLSPADDGRAGLMVVGGDTLSTVLEAARTESLQVLGELGPGIPLVKVQGGSLNGRRMVTKSGGFGPPELLRSLLGGHACHRT